MSKFKCCICGKEHEGFGNNPYPLCDVNDYNSECCNECNSRYVIPARICGLGNLTEQQINDFVAIINDLEKMQK